jgi:hypothetical protein
MRFTLSLLASSNSEVDWSIPLMIGWIVIALALSVIEVFWLKGGRNGPGSLRYNRRSKGYLHYVFSRTLLRHD